MDCSPLDITSKCPIASRTVTEVEALDDDGNVKDAHYGEGSSEANFRMAQTALQGIGEYPKKLIESQNVDGIDAVSGATVSLLDFRNAVKQALEEARR